MTTRPSRSAMSAGGVVYRRRGGHVEVVLVGRSRARLWALPKGTPEPGETIEETALREVREETGLEVSVDRELGNGAAGEIGSIRYMYSERDDARSEGTTLVRKIVHHFLMRPTGGDLDGHDHEYDLVQWCDVHEALRRMSYANERHILERALALIDAQNDAGSSDSAPALGAAEVGEQA